jgi:hypothetical protein
MLGLQITTAPIAYSLWIRLQKYRPLMRHDSRLRWYIRQQNSDPFALTNVRIEPHLSHGHHHVDEQAEEDADVSQKSRYSRVMPVLENLREKRNQENKSDVQTYSTYTVPTWKTRDLGDLVPDDRSSALGLPVIDSDDETETNLERKQTPIPTQIGDALKGTTDDDSLVPTTQQSDTNPVTTIRRKLKSKRPRLFSLNSRADSWDDIEPPFTALGASEQEGPKTSQERRQNVVISGHVAFGLAQAGAALASSAGGAVGKNLLVQMVEKESERLHNMLHSGLSRVRTDEELDYEERRDEFVQGRKMSSSQLRKRARTKSRIKADSEDW